MNNGNTPVSVVIMDKEYLISCDKEEKQSLRDAVDFLNKKMLEIKQSSGVIGSERIAVMTALNITNELLAYKKENQDYTFKIDNTLKRLQTKINNTLGKEKQTDIVDDIDNSVSQGG